MADRVSKYGHQLRYLCIWVIAITIRFAGITSAQSQFQDQDHPDSSQLLSLAAMIEHDEPAVSTKAAAQAPMISGRGNHHPRPAPVVTDILLADNGVAKATIVIADRPDLTPVRSRRRSAGNGKSIWQQLTVEAWALELAHRLKVATGATFKVATVSQAPQYGNLILVGTSTLSKKYGFDGAVGMKTEEARVQAFRHGLAIYGERTDATSRGALPREVSDLRDPVRSQPPGTMSDRGTGHAVIWFLEKFVGYQFYWPQEVWVHVPARKRLVVRSDIDFCSRPAFAYRWGLARGSDGHVPLRYLAYKWGASVELSVNHCIVLHRKDYPATEDQTELFAKGEDGKPMFGRSKHVPPCYASLKHVDEYLNHVRYFDATGRKKYYFKGGRGNRLIATPNRVLVGPPDVVWRDHDPRALKWYRSKAEPTGSQSDLLSSFVATLARRVNTEWPGRRVTLLAHNNFAAAASNRVELPDNVDILAALARYATPLTAQEVYKVINDRFIDEWYEKLGRKRSRLAIWDYAIRPQKWVKIPCFYPNTIQRFLKRNRDRIAGQHVNGNGDAMALPMRALWADLLWDPDLDVEAWFMKFNETMFGPAGQTMYELMRYCAQRYETTVWAKKSSRLGGRHARPRDAIAYLKIFPPDAVEKVRSLFAQAVRLAQADSNRDYAKRLALMYNEGGPQGFHAFFTASESFHDPSQTKPLVAVPAAEGQIKPDGRLEEDVWERAEIYDLLEGDDPKILQPAREGWEGRFQCGFTQEALYVAFDLNHQRRPVSRARKPSQVAADANVMILFYGASRGGRRYRIAANHSGMCTSPQVTVGVTVRRFNTKIELRIPWNTIDLDKKDLPPSLKIDVRRYLGGKFHAYQGWTRFAYAVGLNRQAVLHLGNDNVDE